MKSASLTILATLFLATGTQAGPKEDAQARAALELSLALGKQQAVKQTRPDYSAAYAMAIKDGAPLLIHVGGFDCQHGCKDSGARVCDADEVFGDKTPRLILAAPSGGKLLFVREWRAVPKSDAIKAAVAACCRLPGGK